MTGDELQRAIQAYIEAHPYKEAGLLILAAAEALLAKQTSYAPSGAALLRLQTQDERLTVCLARGQVAPMLSVAYDSVKTHIGAGGEA